MSSWTEELDRLQNLNKNSHREYARHIPFTLLYVNHENDIEKVQSGLFQLDVSSNNSIITKEKILAFITKNTKENENSKYVCKEISIFQVPIEPENIQYFSQMKLNENTIKPYFKTFSLVDTIYIQPSIFIFHSLNRLFFKFIQAPLRSSMKQKRIGNITKRVRIQLPRTTRKIHT